MLAGANGDTWVMPVCARGMDQPPPRTLKVRLWLGPLGAHKHQGLSPPRHLPRDERGAPQTRCHPALRPGEQPADSPRSDGRAAPRTGEVSDCTACPRSLPGNTLGTERL